MKTRRPRSTDFTIGWICPLPLEYVAAKSVLDELYDETDFLTGRIHNHDIVITCLPAGQMGTNAAAAATERMRAAFPSIKHALLVGIAGGAPSDKADIRLGDVVVGHPDGQYGGVVQYDFGKTLPGGFQRVGYLNAPSQELLSAVSRFTSNLDAGKGNIKARTREQIPAAEDVLFRSSYDHVGGDTCDRCVRDMVVQRLKRDGDIGIFFGTVASGNLVIKDGTTRDKSSTNLGGVLCFEMEAAGVVNLFPCLVVRGICDYADSHKNKAFQPLAAATAAACAREILLYLPSSTRDKPDHPTRHLSAEQRQLYLESLSFQQLHSRFETIKMAHNKTCQWLLDTQEYKNWLDENYFDQHHGFLWIKGKPGSGKSTIMKFVSLQMVHDPFNVPVLSFFFNARGNALEKTVVGMYRSLAFQLLDAFPDLQSIFDMVPTRVAGNPPPAWEIETLKSLLSAAVEKLQERPLAVYIDALDECDEEEVRDMLCFFEELGELAVSHKVRLFVCFSSRHYPHVTISHNIELVLQDQDGHRQDILDYVYSELRIGHGDHVQQIKDGITERASGVFLWVALVVRILNKEFDRGRVHTIKRRLKEIPDGLHALLKDLLTRDNHDRDATLLCLQWILYANRPLGPTELYFAILAGTEPDPGFLADWTAHRVTEDVMLKFVLDSSKGLAQVNSSDQGLEIQFIHESVRDFLRSPGFTEIGLGSIAPGPSHEALKISCLNYVLMDLSFRFAHAARMPNADTREAKLLLASILQEYPFLQYAVEHILYHANEASEHGIPQAAFLTNFPNTQWIMKDNIIEYNLAAARAGHEEATKILFTTSTFGKRLLSHDRRKNVPLLFATSKTSQLDLPRLLAESGALGKTPLSQATRLNLEAVAKGLLSIGASTKCKDYEGFTPLHHAAMDGMPSMVSLLIAAGADLEAGELSGWTPLILCSVYRTDTDAVTIAELLLDAGANIEAADHTGGTPLFYAVDDNSELIELLIDRGARLKPVLELISKARSISAPLTDIEDRDDDGLTALHRAVLWGLPGLVTAILVSGADPNSRDHAARTPLSYAAERIGGAVLERLLDYGADVHAVDLSGRTALFYAARMGWTSEIRMLLEHGADPKVRDNDGLRAADYTKTKGARRLLDGVDVSDEEEWPLIPPGF